MYSKILSIIVPVYNAEKYLSECLDSLINQDVAPDQYEIICINDGSTDKSLDILNSYANKYKNIIIVNKENGGAAAARNTGIDLATGRYIWFVDSDDLIRPNCLNSIFNLIQKHAPDAIRIKMIINTQPPSWENSSELNSTISSSSYPSAGICESILSNEIISKYNLRFDTQFISGEDQIFHLHFWMCSKGTDYLITPEIYFYRQHNESTMHSISHRRRLIDNFQMAIHINHLVSECEPNKRSVLIQKKFHYTWYILYFLPRSGFDRKKVIARLKAEKLIIPFLWAIPEKRKSLKWKTVKFVSRLFSIKPFYLLYYAYARRKAQQ